MPPRLLLALAIVLASASTTLCAKAAPPDNGPEADRVRAAASFDEGVGHYKRAEYAEAARAFQEADRLAPSATAITNAVAAAKRAGDHLLAARLAQRAIARGEALVESREALADAATHLCRFELTCAATACTLTLDAAPATATTYALAGTHAIEARGNGATAEEHVLCAAGATYRIDMRPVPLVNEAPLGALPASEGSRPTPAETSHGLPRGVFFAAVGVTAVLAGVTVWSGLDALAGKNALPPGPTQAEENAVLSRAHRTDFLLLGAGVAALGTTLLGALGTSWHPQTSAPAVVVTTGRLELAYQGRF
jgi:tetratricopeptide (TPR) repeat protein